MVPSFLKSPKRLGVGGGPYFSFTHPAKRVFRFQEEMLLMKGAKDGRFSMKLFYLTLVAP